MKIQVTKSDKEILTNLTKKLFDKNKNIKLTPLTHEQIMAITILDMLDVNEEYLNTWWNNRPPEIKKMIYLKWFNQI